MSPMALIKLGVLPINVIFGYSVLANAAPHDINSAADDAALIISLDPLDPEAPLPDPVRRGRPGSIGTPLY